MQVSSDIMFSQTLICNVIAILCPCALSRAGALMSGPLTLFARKVEKAKISLTIVFFPKKCCCFFLDPKLEKLVNDFLGKFDRKLAET